MNYVIYYLGDQYNKTLYGGGMCLDNHNDKDLETQLKTNFSNEIEVTLKTFLERIDDLDPDIKSAEDLRAKEVIQDFLKVVYLKILFFRRDWGVRFTIYGLFPYPYKYGVITITNATESLKEYLNCQMAERIMNETISV